MNNPGYTDPKLLDVLGALETLPSLPLVGVADVGQLPAQSAVSAMGTDDSTSRQFAPGFAPTRGKTCRSLASVVKMTAEKGDHEDTDAIAISGCGVKRKDPLTTVVNESCEWAMRGSNPRLPRCKRGALTN